MQGEILDLKITVNEMVGQLTTLAQEVTRVSLEVGTEGKLGGQAVVNNVEGVWKALTDNVNLMVGAKVACVLSFGCSCAESVALDVICRL